ncbi:MAG: hypothetical protein HY074_18565 [Deltaproteobacteria bacterium]|nr:hypothetical protein [Deltaproteobacteria bacterium]
MKVINMKTYRVFKQRVALEARYRHSLLKMGKAELLQELLNYHECYQRDPHDIGVTLRGQHLMDVLEDRAELAELQELSREFQVKLKTRLYEQMQSIGE